MSKAKKEMKYFEDLYHLRQLARCCGTCKYFDRDQDHEWYCDHPDAWKKPNVNGYFTDAGHVCDAWETTKEK